MPILSLFMLKPLTLLILLFNGTYIGYLCLCGYDFQEKGSNCVIGTYISEVLVNDGYLCSRVYGNKSILAQLWFCIIGAFVMAVLPAD